MRLLTLSASIYSSAVSSNIPPGSFPAPTTLAHSLTHAQQQPVLSSSAQLAQYLTDFESDFISERYRSSVQPERTAPAVAPPVVDTELEQELAQLEELEELIATGESTTAAREQQQNRWANEQCLVAPSASSLSSTSSLEIEYNSGTGNANPKAGGVVRNTITITPITTTSTNTTSKMAPPTSTSGQQRSVSFASPPTTSQIEPDGSRTQPPATLAPRKSPQPNSVPSPTHNVYPQTQGLKVPTSSETPKASVVERARRSISPERPNSLECSYSLEEGEEFDDEMATALAPGLVGYKALDADTLAGMEYIPTLKVSLSYLFLYFKILYLSKNDKIFLLKSLCIMFVFPFRTTIRTMLIRILTMTLYTVQHLHTVCHRSFRQLPQQQQPPQPPPLLLQPMVLFTCTDLASSHVPSFTRPYRPLRRSSSLPYSPSYASYVTVPRSTFSS